MLPDDLWFAGDLHGDFRALRKMVSEQRPRAVVMLGDIQAPRPLEQELGSLMEHTEFWFIHGNHDTDFDADYDHLWSSALANRNLDGRVVEIAGVRIAGLGGVFRGRVWMPPAAPVHESRQALLRTCPRSHRWRADVPRDHHSTIFPATYDALAQQRADVLVSHEAPSTHRNGFEAIDLLAASLGVGRVFHGHHHDCLNYSGALERLGFSVHGVGLRGITRLDGSQVRAGELDAARAHRQTWL